MLLQLQLLVVKVQIVRAKAHGLEAFQFNPLPPLNLLARLLVSGHPDFSWLLGTFFSLESNVQVYLWDPATSLLVLRSRSRFNVLDSTYSGCALSSLLSDGALPVHMKMPEVS